MVRRPPGWRLLAVGAFSRGCGLCALAKIPSYFDGTRALYAYERVGRSARGSERRRGFVLARLRLVRAAPLVATEAIPRRVSGRFAGTYRSPIDSPRPQAEPDDVQQQEGELTDGVHLQQFGLRHLQADVREERDVLAQMVRALRAQEAQKTKVAMPKWLGGGKE